MCRNIKTLFNFAPPATELEIRDAARRAEVDQGAAAEELEEPRES